MSKKKNNQIYLLVNLNWYINQSNFPNQRHNHSRFEFCVLTPPLFRLCFLHRIVDEFNAKQKSVATTATTKPTTTKRSSTTLTTPKTTITTVQAAPSATARAQISVTAAQNVEKPTIYEILSEFEKNHTQTTHRANPVTPSSVPMPNMPMALALSAQLPIQNQRSDDSPKAIVHHLDMHHNSGHAGVAEPLTWQQLESEMTIVEQSLKDTSTSKDGISTWILLSGSDKQQQMATPATTTVSHVEKLDVQDKLSSDRLNYRFGEAHTDKIGKPAKNRENIENKKPKPDKKKATAAHSSPSTAGILIMKTTPLPPPSSSGILLASDLINRRKTPSPNANKLIKRKPTTTSTEPPMASSSIEKFQSALTTIDEIETTTPIVIELEPKDANFDLPQDRSPAPKKPSKAKQTKRKPNKKHKVTSVSKQPNKNKDKPISTTIYNYLSREVMPSVGILGAGILLTAGLASYIFGPFGALRRSYDDASDRQDNVDNIYSVNSEEYANEGNDNGQHEEEVFSKFLAGMPVRDVPRYVKYFKQHDPTHLNQVNQPMSGNHPYRAHQVRLQSQPSSNAAPKYGAAAAAAPGNAPYMRYRMAPSPHYNTAQYNPQQPSSQVQSKPQIQYSTYRNHQMSTQPVAQVPAQTQSQPQIVSPVYNPQYHDTQNQKSFTNNMDAVLQHQTTIYGQSASNSDIQVSPSANLIEEKSIDLQIPAESETEIPQPQAESLTGLTSLTSLTSADVMDSQQQTIDDITQEIQRRTNTYVVGSSITASQPGEAIVSASMSASADGLNHPTKRRGIVENVEPGVITVTASSHGPRRRRRNTDSVVQISSKRAPIPTTVKEKAETTIAAASTLPTTTTTTTTTTTAAAPTTTTASEQNTRLYSTSDLSSLISEYNLLNEKIMSFDREYANEETEKRVERKIQTEFKSITVDYEALKKAIDGAKAVEKFEKQAHIRAKNYELSVVLKTGISTLRQRINHLNDLVEHPDDERIIEKINRRDGSNGIVSSTQPTPGTASNSSTSITINEPELENGFVGFLKLLQLKAQFGLNLLQNIRPSFERAFEDVFQRPYKIPN